MIHTETVHPSQLRRAMASYANQGYPPAYGPHPGQPGMMVIVITVPDDAAIPDWEMDAPRPRRRFRVNLQRLARGLVLLLALVAVVYIAYAIFTDGLPQTTSSAARATPEPSLWDRIADALPHGEPVVEHVPPKVIEMPWDSAARAASDVANAVVQAITAIGALLVLAVVGWLFIKIRGGMHK